MDSKEPAPVLVKKDGERQPVASTMTRDEMFELVKVLVQGQQGAAASANAQIGEIADAMAQIKSDQHKGDYNLANFPDRSVFNPKGERDAPRPEIDGEVFWVGTLMDAREHTPEEIALINALQPGTYHGGKWQVIDMIPGQRGKRKLLVKFPCKDADERASLPSLREMCQEMVNEANGLVAVPA